MQKANVFRCQSSYKQTERVSPGENIGCEYRFLAGVFDVRTVVDDPACSLVREWSWSP
jgi:hypothetical protein